MALRTASTNGMRRLGDDRDIPVVEYEIEREIVMKFKPIYEALHAYFLEKGFVHPQTGDEKYEDLYWERWMPQGHKEQHIWWRMKKDINPYIRYFIQFDYQTLLVAPREIAYNGKKKTLEYVDCIIRVKAFLQFDIDDKFKKSWGWKIRKAFFNKIYKQEIDQHKMELYNIAMELQRLAKQLLEMHADRDVPKDFMPVLGYKE